MEATFEKVSYSTNLVTQGSHKFYSFTMPSDVLACCCFVTSRKDDPTRGFQRNLDKKRAQSIAEYIDSGLGTIPSAIVLSAQPEAEFAVVGRGKTVEFQKHPNAFLIIDGQHRVYGFSMAKTSLRVPVIVYNGLTKAQEAQLFIDINTTQRPVPSELLLDIQRLAEREGDPQKYLRNLFDLFYTDSKSCMLGELAPSEKSKGKITRVTFNASLGSLLPLFEDKTEEEIFNVINPYLSAMRYHISTHCSECDLNNPTLFRAIIEIFKPVAQKIKDRHGRKYNYSNFSEIIEPFISRIKINTLKKPGISYKALVKEFEKAMNQDFSLF